MNEHVNALGVTSYCRRMRIVIKHQILDETSYNTLIPCLFSATGIGNFHISGTSQVHSLHKLGGLNFRIWFRLGQL
jgi:hypothetical protein